MNKKLISFAITALLAASGFAQSAAPAAGASNAPNHPMTINHRKYNQQRRIRQGDRSGQLTRGETRHLEKQEHAINHEERDMRRQDNGKLTAQDRKTLRKQQNQESKRIYRDKHNARRRG